MNHKEEDQPDRDTDRQGADLSPQAYFASNLPEPQAIAQLASHLQDHASENSSTFGVPLPPCPGHQHPLNADVADGVAVWACPVTPAHYQQPIVT